MTDQNIDSRNPSQNKSELSRRSVLQATGVSALGVGSLASRVASAREPAESVVRLQGTWDEPITESQINEVVRRLLRQYRRSGREVPDRIPMAEPTGRQGYVDENGTQHERGQTVEAVIGLRADGIPRMFRHTVASPDVPLDNARAAGEAKATSFSVSSDGYTSQSGDLTTQSTTDPDKEWEFILDDQNQYEAKPYGIVYNNCEWWKVKESYDDNDENVHLLKQISAMEPGESQDGWDSTYHNEWMEDDHKWSNADYTLSGIHDIDPANPDDSSEIQVSLGYATQGGGTASVTWTFTNDGCIKNISTADYDVHWELHCLYNADRRSRIQIEPGSVAVMDDDRNNSCSEFATVTRYRNTGHFENDFLQNAYAWQESGFGYTSYC